MRQTEEDSRYFTDNVYTDIQYARKTSGLY